MALSTVEAPSDTTFSVGLTRAIVAVSFPRRENFENLILNPEAGARTEREWKFGRKGGTKTSFGLRILLGRGETV